MRNLEGRRFGKLVAISSSRIGDQRLWVCACDCGGSRRVLTGWLVAGRAKSCGCGTREPAISYSPEYKVWRAMIRRCTSPKDCNYDRYGARGISVCEKWKDFRTFLADIGPRPTPDHSIERIDNNGHYEPSNCKWATTAEQNRNTRQNVLLTLNGDTKCLVEWAASIGISSPALAQRIARGWPLELALTRKRLPPGSRLNRLIDC